MTTLKELRTLAKAYGLPRRSKLKKYDLQKAIAEVRAAEFIKRLQRGQETGRLSSIREDVENPHKKGRRVRELRHINDEVDAALRTKKYIADVDKKPSLRQKPLKQITDRLHHKPYLYGLTRSRKETLAQAIKREGPALLQCFLDPDIYYQGGHSTWNSGKSGNGQGI